MVLDPNILANKELQEKRKNIRKKIIRETEKLIDEMLIERWYLSENGTDILAKVSLDELPVAVRMNKAILGAVLLNYRHGGWVTGISEADANIIEFSRTDRVLYNLLYQLQEREALNS